MERLRREEAEAAAAREKGQSGRTVRCLEQELAEKQAELQTVQVRGCERRERGEGTQDRANKHKLAWESM